MDNKMKWVNYSLDSVARLVSGRTPDREKKEYYAAEGTPWVKIENLDQGYITSSSEYLSAAGRARVNLVPAESVLFSIVGTVGKVGIAGTELATNQQIVSLVFNETKMYPLFGYYLLRYHAENIRKLSDQTTMALISRKTLGQYRVCVPEDIREQKNIAERLYKFESYIYKKQDMKQQILKYEHILFRKIFENELLYHERLKLGEYLDGPVISGIPKNEEPDEEYAKLLPEDFHFPYIREDRKFIQGVHPDKKYMIRQGDVLLRNGRLILAENMNQDVFIDRSIIRLRTLHGQLLPEVLYGYLNLPEIKETLYAERKKGDQRKRPIRPSELEKMDLPYFTMEMQEEYKNCLEKIRIIQKSLDKEIDTGWKTFYAVCDLWMRERSEAVNKKRPEVSKEKISEIDKEREKNICHVILAVLAGWSPEHDEGNRYFLMRQKIFKRAQKIFQPVALSFVTEDGQKEYLLERDFLAYKAEGLCSQHRNPLELLKRLLKDQKNGSMADAHIAFPGEDGIQTEKDWDPEIMKKMALDAYHLLAVYSGFSSCCFLFFDEERDI